MRDAAVRLAALVILLVATLGAVPVQAGDPAAGRKKATMCQACHGLDGLSKTPDAPNLAGQNEFYLLKALKDFRTGARKSEQMSMIAPSLEEGDVADLAAYYSSIKISVTPP